MTKMKITISLDEDIAKQLRSDSFEKYGNARSLSRYIEDLATGAVEKKTQAEACPLGYRSKQSFEAEEDFNKAVEEITKQLSEIRIPGKIVQGMEIMVSKTEMYFLMKEACEMHINKSAESVNVCPGCCNLTGPVPTYPDAGKNFELFAKMDNSLR